MKVLVLGSGAKDHAISWMFAKSKRITGLYIAPGNAGTERIGKNINIDISNPEQVYEACRAFSIDYVFAGTEKPLAAGVVDFLKTKGIKTFGAHKAALRLESDRAFSRGFTERYEIPSSSYTICSSKDEIQKYIDEHKDVRFVMKLNGLAPSRVMLDSADSAQLLTFGFKHVEHDAVIIEEHLKGTPLTITTFIDEKGYLILPVCSDYTKAEDFNKGKATGGMGSICPVPVLNKTAYQDIIDSIIEPTLLGMLEEEITYKGVLIFSIILTDNGAKLVDFHVRFNDPATQAMVPLIHSDLIDIIDAIEEERITTFNLELTSQTAVAVVIASEGYPESTQEDIRMIDIPNYINHNTRTEKSLLFYGAVDRDEQGLHSNGGRCFTVVGLGTNILEANERAYAIVPHVNFPNSWYRSDIGNHFFDE